MAIDLQNWRDAQRFMIEAGFVGGCYGIEEDLVHYSIDEITKSSDLQAFKRWHAQGNSEGNPETRREGRRQNQEWSLPLAQEEAVNTLSATAPASADFFLNKVLRFLETGEPVAKHITAKRTAGEDCSACTERQQPCRIRAEVNAKGPSLRLFRHPPYSRSRMNGPLRSAHSPIWR